MPAGSCGLRSARRCATRPRRAAPPLSGCASRSRRRKRRFTSSRSTSMPARRPEHLHRPALVGGRCPATAASSGGRARLPLARPPRAAGAGRPTCRVGDEPQLDVGREPAPAPVDDAADARRARPCARSTCSARRAHHRAEHLRDLARRATSSSMTSVPSSPSMRCRDRSRPCTSYCSRCRSAMRGIESPRARVVDEPGAAARAPRRRPRAGSSPRPRPAARPRAPGPTWAGTRRRARPGASACAGGCDGRSARRAARRPPGRYSVPLMLPDGFRPAHTGPRPMR